jgi:ribonucleoside-diphosphate reductase alpha chain
VWNAIVKDEGSVRGLDFLSDDDKDVFKTAFEIDQLTLIDLAADRQPFICQAQSLNLFFSKDVDPQYFHEVHWTAWLKKVKTLYYVRSSSVLRADLSSRGECVACEG